MARSMGMTMSQWDELEEHDRAWALGAEVAELEDAALRCPACGGPASECQDTDNQHAYVVSFRRCYRTAAVEAAQEKRRGKDGTGDMRGVLTIVTLDPSLKKSATKKGGAR